MPSRRQHQKTRHGCSQCKAKRVKCDEEQPSCGRCAKAHLHCSLLETRPLRLFGTSRASSATTQNRDTPTSIGEQSSAMDVSRSAQRSPSGWQRSPDPNTVDNAVHTSVLTGSQWSALDREIHQHYITVAWLQFDSSPSKQQVWQHVIPHEALRYDFLMHALLATAAVHLMHARPDRIEVYEEAARTHQDVALTLSIPLFNSVTPTNCHALWALSTLVAFLAFFLPCKPSPESAPSPIAQITNFFALLGGAKTVLKSAAGCVDRGPFAQLTRFRWKPTLLNLPDDVQFAFDRLTQLNEETTIDTEYQHIYNLTIQDLIVSFQTYHIISDEPPMVFLWAKIVQEPYLAALKNSEPMALAILAHYAVLLHSINEQWWSKERGSLLIEEIVRRLPVEWLPAVQWPQDVIRGNIENDLATEDDGWPWWERIMVDFDDSEFIDEMEEREDWCDFRFSIHQELLASYAQRVPGYQSPDQVEMEHI